MKDKNKRERIHEKFVNETGRFLKQIEQESTEKFKKYIEDMKSIVKKSNFYSNNVENSLDNVRKNFRKIGALLCFLLSSKNLHSNLFKRFMYSVINVGLILTSDLTLTLTLT